MDFILLKNVSERENSKKLTQHQGIQDRKSFHLSSPQNINTINLDNVVFNLSNRLILTKEEEILSKGLNFANPPAKLKFCSFLTPFEKFYYQLKQEPIYQPSDFSPASFKAKLKDIVTCL